MRLGGLLALVLRSERVPRGRDFRACGRAWSGRSANAARPPTSARDNARWRSGSPRPRSLPAAARRRGRRAAPSAPCSDGCDGATPKSASGGTSIIAGARIGFGEALGRRHGRRRRAICAAICGNSSTPMLSPSASTTARNTAFSSWRTLPGQRWRPSSASASPLMRAHALAFFGGDPGEEMPHQVRDVFGALAQRRHRDREHVQAIEQVFAEAAAFDVVDQVAVGGRDDPHVDLDGLAPADRLDLALLDGAQQLDLRRHRQFADLVEEQRAAGGFDELAECASRSRR